MFSRACFRVSRLGRPTLARTIVISPAINDHPAYHFPAVLPFGFDFVNDELKSILESRNVDVDNLEKQYNNQIQNDAEFNNPALPREGSLLWGYIYANRLIKSKIDLKTLSKEDEYMINYLRATIEELEVRLSRYYPNLDYIGEYNKRLELARQNINKNYENAKNDSIATIIEENSNNYIKLFENNSFIDKYDENDKFCDFLPSNLEEKLITWFEYYFDHSSDNTNVSKYFNSIQQIEKSIETPINALSKELKQV